jgi:hypothetical protein
LGKCLSCPPNFQNAYNYLTTPLSTIYNPYHCYFTLYTTSGAVPNTNHWRIAYNYCVNLYSGSSLLRIENALYTYDQSIANFMIDTPRFFIAWLDSQSLNTPSPDSTYYYSNGYPVPGPYNFWGSPTPSTESVIIYGNPANTYWYFNGLDIGWCNTVCQYGF